MLRSPRKFTRRDALKVVGGSVAGLTAVGQTAGGSNTVSVNVGYDSVVGRQAALRVADEVVYDYGFDAVTVRAPASALETLAGTPGVRYAERDGRMEVLAQDLPWGVDRVDAEAAHASGDTGAGADVAIIDTGIDDGHPDLDSNLGTGVAFMAGVQTNQWNDDNGHGTHCAGIADAVDNSQGVVGVSTDATLHAVKVMNAVGTGLTSDIARGIEWTADQGYDVASLSLGSSSGAAVVQDACTYAHDQGVFVAAAAGNSGPCTDCVAYPAAYGETVAVSATDRDDSFAGYSSQGPEVDVAAPGTDIYSTYVGGYSTLSGTSMACPHVSGAAGQLMANGYSNTEARDRLAATAEDVGLSANESGAGLLDVAGALGVDSSDDLS